jgi:3-hydroxyethyl bacteriochlorophyllide a dehydrogenase
MNTMAVVLKEPESLALSRVDLTSPGDEDVVVDMEWTGISTGTEKLLWSGRMPAFPGMGYPLVPGYESVGRVSATGARASARVGERVFVPGARCFGAVRGLFGGAAARLVVPGDKIVSIGEDLGERGVLLALAATAYHAIAGGRKPDLIVGHGVLGRLLARIAILGDGETPAVWERNPDRAHGAVGYRVLDPADDRRRDYRAIYDVSGDAGLIDTLIGRLGHGGELVLAGFYPDPVTFQFPPAFMREVHLRIAAEWREPDLVAVTELIRSGRLSLDGLITHRRDAVDAPEAYRTAFTDPTCLKMILDWRTLQ